MMGFNMDKVLAWLVERTVNKATKSSFETWHPGEKLEILLIGYNGKRNTGSDVRVSGMVEQFYHILGKENVEIGILAQKIENIEGYFSPPTKLIPLSTIFFKPLLEACCQYHMGVLSEGSTLKSKWANALTLFFVEGCGIMKQQSKPCIAYGSEAGQMDDFVYEIAKRHCNQTYFIGRSQPSLDIIRGMGLKGEIGTDTAFTFPPAPREWAEKELKEKAGWDGKKPLIGIAAINPFCWPVKPHLKRWISGYGRRYPQYHYDKFYFYSSTEKGEKLFDNYLTGIAGAVDEFTERHNAQAVIFAMDGTLDPYPCLRLQETMKTKAHFFNAQVYDGFQMMALLRTLSMLITSRYHARVLSLPGGIPGIAISMDERLYNIFQEAGHLKDYYISTEEAQLGEKLAVAMEKLWENREKVRGEIMGTIPKYLRMMAGMGKTFRNFVKKNFPEFPLPPEPKDWLGYLPPLYPELDRIVKGNL